MLLLQSFGNWQLAYMQRLETVLLLFVFYPTDFKLIVIKKE
jgi:hypothetical protein